MTGKSRFCNVPPTEIKSVTELICSGKYKGRETVHIECAIITINAIFLIDSVLYALNVQIHWRVFIP